MTTHSTATALQDQNSILSFNFVRARMKKNHSSLTDVCLLPRETASHVPRRDVQ